jgi:restriction endonuclease S subunit
MMKEDKSTATPRLRFPEFREAPEWELKRLEEIAPLQRGFDLTSSELMAGDVPVVYSNGIRSYHNVGMAKGPGLVTGRSGTIGNLHYIEVGDYWPHNTSLWVTTFNGHHPRFVYYMYAAIGLDRFASGSGVPTLNRNDVHAFESHVPVSKKEQQKIADCLTSLDELIAAQGRKVEALKARKRGLMQQLFPGEGESLPRLRFPEFREGSEWVTRELGPMTSKVGSGITPLGGDKNYKTVGRPFVRSQNVGWGELILDDVAYIDEDTHRTFDATEIQDCDVLLNITGASIGRSAVADSRIVGGNVNQHVCIVRVKASELNPIFLNHYLISDRGQKQIDSFQAGGNRQGLNFAQIRSFEIPLPPTEREQQQIADCLSSLTARIIAESESLDTLKTHKKSLMNQLFPLPKDGL